jgi:hypothetical protein
MANATYRFLPWARRGLADRIVDADNAGPLPARAKVTVGLTITSIEEAKYDLSLYGPGDVIGVDPRLIIRTDPRPSSTDVEPNYFPLIEFDPPDFPWLFTPAKSGTNDHLRPWCVLIVVDLDVVAAPRGETGRPLPVLVVPSSAVAVELPDLEESWAWAHTQVVTPVGAVNLATELADKPAMNVSRIVAARRLEPGKRYAACLVPAFDAGVARGLGDSPPATGTIGPAWKLDATQDVRLPVYFHWEFATGPAGDFEELARRLKPFAAAETVGFERMYIGNAGPELPAMPGTDPKAFMEMDGALRAPKRSSGTLADVPAAVQTALKSTLDAAAAQTESGPTPTTPVLGPPLYGEWHAKQHTVPADQPTWLRELNLDPRTRAAAGLGAEIERQNQEDFMQWSWEQVGRILDANRLLSRARLSLEALTRVHAKHLATQPPDRLLQIAGALHTRTVQAGVTLSAAIARSSLPNAAADPALRRLTSAQRPVLKAAVRRAPSLGGAPAVVAPRVRLVPRLSTGELEVDSTRFTPHGVLGIPSLGTLAVPPEGNAPIDLTSVGLRVAVPATLVRQLRDDTAAVMADRAPRVVARADLRTTGLAGEAQLDRARELLGGIRPPTKSLTTTLRAVTTAAAAAPGAAGLLVTLREGQAPVAQGIDVDASGRVLLRTAAGQPSPQVATLARALPGTGDASAVLAKLPPNAIDPTTKTPPTISGPVTAPRIDPVLGPRLPVERAPIERDPIIRVPTKGETITLPPLVRDPSTITRLESSIVKVAPSGQVGGAPPPALTFVAFAIPAARETLVTRTNPRLTVPKRLGTMLAAGGKRLLTDTPTGITVVPTFDRILAAPELDVPVYEYLARLDPARFLPGVGEIPEDAITLLETNPRFIESVMIGLNSEMNRELLWRSFPTDQRGTPFRKFWAWTDGGSDIAPIHTWPKANALGANGRSGPGGQIALLVRGRLLRRYPNTSIFAWRSKGGFLINPPGPTDLRQPVFAGVLGADIVFVGFDLTDVELTAGDGWFFVLQEQPTEPRFGFDEFDGTGAPPALGSWSDATWTHTGTPSGRYLRIAGNPLANVQIGGVRFVGHGAHLAAITIQKPMRVAVHARSMVQA